MHIRLLLLSMSMVTLMLGGSAVNASAATLFTSAAHTTEVSVGATASATATGTGLRLTSGTATVFTCANVVLAFTVTGNSGGSVVSTATSGTFAGCTLATTFTLPWRLSITGSGTMVGASTAWAASFNFRADLIGGLLHGDLTTGISATQGTASTAGLCVDFDRAGTLTHPLTTQGQVDGQLCFTGTAANWSLG